MTTTMKAAQISKPGGEWELVERVIPEPRAGHVRVKVEACGICHSDVLEVILKPVDNLRGFSS